MFVKILESIEKFKEIKGKLFVFFCLEAFVKLRGLSYRVNFFFFKED